MTSTNVAITIWWKTILINAILIGAGSIMYTGIFFFLVIIVLTVGGFIVTLPLLPLIELVVKIHTLIPYSNAARRAWLTFMLLLMVWVIYCAFTLVTEMDILTWEPLAAFAGCATSIAVIIAMELSSESINYLTHPRQAELIF